MRGPSRPAAPRDSAGAHRDVESLRVDRHRHESRPGRQQRRPRPSSWDPRARPTHPDRAARARRGRARLACRRRRPPGRACSGPRGRCRPARRSPRGAARSRPAAGVGKLAQRVASAARDQTCPEARTETCPGQVDRRGRPQRHCPRRTPDSALPEAGGRARRGEWDRRFRGNRPGCLRQVRLFSLRRAVHLARHFRAAGRPGFPGNPPGAVARRPGRSDCRDTASSLASARVEGRRAPGEICPAKIAPRRRS